MTSASLRPGDVLGDKFRILYPISSGGMGEILVAEHLELRIRVAIKVPKSSVLGSEVSRTRFLREARAAAALANQHVCRIFDVARTPAGVPYIVMEYLRGTDLQRLLKEHGSLPVEVAIDYMLQACEGLAEAHAQGIVHRDLKPANLFLTESADRSPLIKVLDFGISRSYADEFSTQITQVDAILGSPHYMSPEQIVSASSVDARSDIWSLGVTLHALLTGTLPFKNDTVEEAFVAISSGTMRIATERMPPRIAAVIARCLVARREDRYADVHALAMDLAAASRDGPTRVRRIERILGASARVGETLESRPVAGSGAVLLDPDPAPPSVDGGDGEVTSHDVEVIPPPRVAQQFDIASPLTGTATIGGSAVPSARRRAGGRTAVRVAVLGGALVIGTIVIAAATIDREAPSASSAPAAAPPEDPPTAPSEAVAPAPEPSAAPTDAAAPAASAAEPDVPRSADSPKDAVDDSAVRRASKRHGKVPREATTPARRLPDAADVYGTRH